MTKNTRTTPDYAWRQLGNKLHAFSLSSTAGMSLCCTVRATSTHAPWAGFTQRCKNCERVVERARIAAEKKAPGTLTPQTQEAVLAEVSAHVPKASSRRLTTLVASRIAVRELRDELKAIEEGLSKRFVLAYRKLDVLEQVFEELTVEAHRDGA